MAETQITVAGKLVKLVMYRQDLRGRCLLQDPGRRTHAITAVTTIQGNGQQIQDAGVFRQLLEMKRGQLRLEPPDVNHNWKDLSSATPHSVLKKTLTYLQTTELTKGPPGTL